MSETSFHTAGQRVRWYPTPGQRVMVRRYFDQARMVYNQGLSQLEVAYRSDEKCSVAELSRRWTDFKVRDPEQRLIPSSVAGQALRHLDSAFKHFFRRVKLKKGPVGYPQPKGRFSPDQCSLTIDPRHAGKASAWQAGELLLPGLGSCRVRGAQFIGDGPKTVTASRDALGRYWLSFNHNRPVRDLGAPEAGWSSEVGIDLGITYFATLSTGQKIDNPRHLNRRLKALRRSQRALSRCQKGSNRRRRRRAQVAWQHDRVASARNDFLHQTATSLLKQFGAIAVEDLNVSGMVRNQRLARHIQDLGLSRFVELLKYKASWYGRSVIQCDRWDPTSQVCSVCGKKGVKLPLSIRAWTCSICSTVHDRDVNAARNVLLYARGKRVQDVEGDTPAAVPRRPMKRQPIVDRPEALTTMAAG